MRTSPWATISMSPTTRRLGRLLRISSEYTAAYMVARLIAAVAGLLLIRLMLVTEYGFYTLLLAAFSFTCTVSDLGATQTLSFFRWRAAKRNRPWLHYFHTVMRLRRVVFALGVIASAGYLIHLAAETDEAASKVLGGIALIALAGWFSIKSTTVVLLLKLQQHLRQAYMVELSMEAIKFLAVCVLWMLGLGTALAGMASVALGAVVASLLAVNLFEHHVAKLDNGTAGRSRHLRKIVLGQVLPILPGTVYTALQPPLVAWLAVYYGSVTEVAKVGALGRLTALIAVIHTITGAVITPRLAAIGDDRLFLARYSQSWLVLIGTGILIVLVAALFPDPLLAMLGMEYSRLETELLIATSAAVVTIWTGFAWVVNRTKGWIHAQPYRVPFIMAGQVVFFLATDFHTAKGVLLFGFGTACMDLVFQTLVSLRGFLNSAPKAGRARFGNLVEK